MVLKFLRNTTNSRNVNFHHFIGLRFKGENKFGGQGNDLKINNRNVEGRKFSFPKGIRTRSNQDYPVGKQKIIRDDSSTLQIFLERKQHNTTSDVRMRTKTILKDLLMKLLPDCLHSFMLMTKHKRTKTRRKRILNQPVHHLVMNHRINQKHAIRISNRSRRKILPNIMQVTRIFIPEWAFRNDWLKFWKWNSAKGRRTCS